jgi:hypothetical protein
MFTFNSKSPKEQTGRVPDLLRTRCRKEKSSLSVLKRVGIWLVSWLLVSNLVAEIGALYMLQPYANPIESARVVSAWQTDPEPDVLFLGASLVQRAFSPKVIRREAEKEIGLAVNTLNCGIPMLHSKEALPYLRTLLRHSHPRVVVYGTSVREFTRYPSAGPRYYRVFASPLDVSWSLIYGSRSYSNFVESMSAYFRPVSLPFQWAVLYGLRVGSYLGLEAARYDQELEQFRRTDGWIAFRRRGRRRQRSFQYQYNSSSIAWENLIGLKRIADAQGILLVVLLMPVGPTHFTSEATSKFAIDLRQRCFKEGIGFFDMNQRPFLPEPAEFEGDALHLLRKGAEKFSRRITRFALLPYLN